MVELIRTCSSIQGTFGMLVKDGIPLCDTCELPDPIPDGTYDCIPHSGPKFKDVWEITNVPGHSDILIHWGNTILDTKLCVLAGNGYAKINGLPGILHSIDTIKYLRTKLPDNFTLTIRSIHA